MNPQQFGNMAGMGGGMPNNMQQMNPQMMNPQIANAMRPQPAMPMQGRMQAQVNSHNAEIQRQVIQALQSQGTFSGGWQATVPLVERAGQVRLLVDSLRLVRPPVEPARATEVAIQFERKAFSQSTNKEQYLQECNNKLTKIRDQRAQQMNAASMGMQDNMQMQNQSFMQQMGQNNIQGMNVPMNPMQQMQNAMMNQRMPNMNQQQPQMMQKQPESLSPEDNQIINQRAADLAKSTPKDKMRQIVDQMNPQLRQSLETKGVDPIIYWFRMMATREFRKQKDPQAAQNQMMGQNMQQNRAMQQGQPIMNGMERFQNQQNEALRLQQEGDMVVPASNNQGMGADHLRLQQQMMANSQRMGQQNPNQAMIERQRQLQLQSAKMQQVNQMRQGQQPDGGMQPNQTPQLGNAGMNMLNQPVGPNVQGTNSQNNSRPPSRLPQQPGQQFNLPDQQKREQFLANLPLPLQNILRQKPFEQWPPIIEQFKRTTAQRQNMAQGQQLQAPNQFMPGQAQQMQQSLSNGAESQLAWPQTMGTGESSAEYPDGHHNAVPGNGLRSTAKE
ncbi:uncharacterized protein AB675_11802 [Cyphellophora attinorum]|uniref:Mediator complex subunit 15 KIX domain-containing protein n=1 Tax=Cyphellophora attinorum TaxID=1664694 RepID=A0A0N1NZ58_9EURO|nr:uncharacterized protein AB675_11802 [Phialophora attinorum]KPI36844.1 hypothetical protein AB675_11802 [Phialophora attinorum]